jgi:hypothetical protein
LLGSFHLEAETRRLNGVGIKNFEITKHSQPGTVSFLFFVGERAVFIKKKRAFILKNHWQSSNVRLIFLNIRLGSINKYAALGAVRVDI